MKSQVYSILILFFASFNVFGQIQISSQDFLPIGGKYDMAFDTIPRLPGNSGVNQMWTFSNLLQPFTLKIEVGNPNTIKYNSYFPTSNTYTHIPGDTNVYDFFNNASNGFYIQGSVYNTSTGISVLRYTPSIKYFSWPMNYLDNFSDSSIVTSIFTQQGSIGIDTTKNILHIYETDTVDAWGTLKTPHRNFQTLRQKKIQIQVDSTWFYDSQTRTWSITNTSLDTLTIYDWIGNDKSNGFLLASITYSKNLNKYLGTYWLVDSNSGIQENRTSNISVWPNPVKNTLSIEMPSTGNYIIELYNVEGKLILSNATKTKKVDLDLERFSSGIYFIRIINTENPILSYYKKIIKSDW